MLDKLDKKIIRAMQGDFPLVAEPFKQIAEEVGITEDELIKRLEGYKKSGKLRKMGAVLRHRQIGFAANALCAWVVPKERVEETAQKMAKNPAVSHCYDRTIYPDWPYNVYTMLHGRSREECEKIADELAAENNLTDRIMLYSVKEWKKTSMQYFKEKA